MLEGRHIKDLAESLLQPDEASKQEIVSSRCYLPYMLSLLYNQFKNGFAIFWYTITLQDNDCIALTAITNTN